MSVTQPYIYIYTCTHTYVYAHVFTLMYLVKFILTFHPWNCSFNFFNEWRKYINFNSNIYFHTHLIGYLNGVIYILDTFFASFRFSLCFLMLLTYLWWSYICYIILALVLWMDIWWTYFYLHWHVCLLFRIGKAVKIAVNILLCQPGYMDYKKYLCAGFPDF